MLLSKMKMLHRSHDEVPVKCDYMLMAKNTQRDLTPASLLLQAADAPVDTLNHAPVCKLAPSTALPEALESIQAGSRAQCK